MRDGDSKGKGGVERKSRQNTKKELDATVALLYLEWKIRIYSSWIQHCARKRGYIRFCDKFVGPSVHGRAFTSCMCVLVRMKDSIFIV